MRVPLPASLRARRDVVLHIGSGKTGTSSVQAFLRENRDDRLAEQGLLYPRTPGSARHVRLGLFAKSAEEAQRSPAWSRHKLSDHASFQEAFRHDLLAEIEASELPRVLLSDEVLFHLSSEALSRLGSLMNSIGEHLRLVAYLRRQDDHMVSRYQQGVKVGMTDRLAEYAQRDLSWFYDYHARLRKHERLLSPTEFVVHRFERDAFAGGSLFQDFLEAASISARADDWHQVAIRNESLDAESVEVLRLLNLYRVQHGGTTRGPTRSRVVRRLAEASKGPTLTLPDPVLDRFMAQWEESNQRVAREFLGDASGELFRSPRRTRNTTTEQRLDVTRLDHYIDLLELPQRMHAPLRALAAHEAKARESS
jgi:hypothetical protein